MQECKQTGRQAVVIYAGRHILQSGRQGDMQPYVHADRHSYRKTGIHVGKQTDNPTGTHEDRQSYRQTKHIHRQGNN